MIEKQENSSVHKNLELGLDKDQAYGFIHNAFESNPQLRISFGNLAQGSLSMQYTNTSEYRKGDTMALDIYKIPIGGEIMIRQEYPVDKWNRERPLGLFLKKIPQLNDNTILPRNWYEVDSKKWNSSNLINRVPGGEMRVNGVLNDVERYEMIFLLYQEFFSEDSTNLAISKERLNIPKVESEIIDDHIRAFEMTSIILNQPENRRFFNYGTKGLFGYDSDPYIACGVEEMG